MKTIIVDDELVSIEILKKASEQVSEIEIIGTFTTAMHAIKFMNKNHVDLMFLDIHMPDFNGFDLVDPLNNPPKIVMISSDRDFAVEAYEYDFIVDYLVKPIKNRRFTKTMERVKKSNSAPIQQNDENIESLSKAVPKERDRALYVNIDRRLVKIDIPSIEIVEAKGDYIKIKTDSKSFVVHSPLKRIEEKLPKDKFLKVHRSFVINIDKIIDIEDNSVLIQRDVIPVSKSNRNELRKRLNLL